MRAFPAPGPWRSVEVQYPWWSPGITQGWAPIRELTDAEGSQWPSGGLLGSGGSQRGASRSPQEHRAQFGHREVELAWGGETKVPRQGAGHPHVLCDGTGTQEVRRGKGGLPRGWSR